MLSTMSLCAYVHVSCRIGRLRLVVHVLNGHFGHFGHVHGFPGARRHEYGARRVVALAVYEGDEPTGQHVYARL